MARRLSVGSYFGVQQTERWRRCVLMDTALHSLLYSAVHYSLLPLKARGCLPVLNPQGGPPRCSHQLQICLADPGPNETLLAAGGNSPAAPRTSTLGEARAAQLLQVAHSRGADCQLALPHTHSLFACIPGPAIVSGLIDRHHPSISVWWPSSLLAEDPVRRSRPTWKLGR